MNIDKLVENITPELFERLQYGASTGKWPDGTVLSDEESSLADNKLLINKTIKTLSQINPAALTAAEVSEIEMFGLTVNRMHTVS